MKVIRFIWRALHEDDGKPSFGRFAAAAWSIALIALDSFFVLVARRLPDGQVFFGEAAIIAAFYSANKFGQAISNAWTSRPDEAIQGGDALR